MPEETLAPPEPAPKKGLFGTKAPPQAPELSDTTEKLNTMAARVRIGEERYSELRKKMLVLEHNMLNNHKKAMNEIKSLQTDLTEIKRTIHTVEDRIITIIKELRMTSRKEDVDVMRRYIEIWDPTKFVTYEQVQKIIREEVHKKQPEKPPNYDSPA